LNRCPGVKALAMPTINLEKGRKKIAEKPDKNATRAIRK
jgi:hypothetical protein